MRVAIYARVSTDAQEARGTIGSQLEVLRARATDADDEIVAEFLDDGHSGARLDRPGLDALRDAAEAGLFDGVWCLSPDRLARVYAYQVVVLDELARFGVRMLFSDAPVINDDPQARLLTQVQGVIAEYERAKISERYRRGKLYRSRAGEVISWKAPYGYRRVPRGSDGPARLEVFEPEAKIVRRIFDDYVSGGHSTRQIVKRLADDSVLSQNGKTMWGTSMIGRLLTNEAYVGRVYYNRTEAVPNPGGKAKSYRQRLRPKEEWIAIAVPPIVSDEVFEAGQRVSRDNSKWSPRKATPGAWLLRGLVMCGSCGVSTACHQLRGRNGTFHRYYYCRNHDPVRAGGEHLRCQERNIRADELDDFVFDQVRQALLRPDMLLAGEHAIASGQPAPDDELLGAQLERLERKLQGTANERRRMVDLYQAGLIDLIELQRRSKEIEGRRNQLHDQRESLATQRGELAKDNLLRHRVTDFGKRVVDGIDALDFEQRQRLLRLVVEEVRVQGWQVEIRLRIPLDAGCLEPPPSGADRPFGPRVSSDMCLRSLHGDRHGLVAVQEDHRTPAEEGSEAQGELDPFPNYGSPSRASCPIQAVYQERRSDRRGDTPPPQVRAVSQWRRLRVMFVPSDHWRGGAKSSDQSGASAS